MFFSQLTTRRRQSEQQLDDAERMLIENATGLLNMQSAKNPFGLGAKEVARVKAHRARMKLVTETLVHRIEVEGPSIDNLKALANAKNDLAEYRTAQIAIDQLLGIAEHDGVMTQDSIAFMMTDRCNLRCKHCFIFNEAVFHPVSRPNELSLSDYATIFQSLRKTGRHFFIHITGGGEVFARKDFEAIMEDLAAMKLGFHVSMQTNGHFPERLQTMVDRDPIRECLKVIQFSLDGLEAVHNAIRGNNNFEKLKRSLEIAHAAGIETSTITTILPENIDSLAEIKAFSESMGVKNHRFQLFFEGSKIGLPEIAKASDFITDRDRSLVYNDLTAPGQGCLAGVRTCVVRPDGTIETCRESYSGNVPRMQIVDLRKYDLDLPKALASSEAINAQRNVKNCVGCAAFCAR